MLREHGSCGDGLCAALEAELPAEGMPRGEFLYGPSEAGTMAAFRYYGQSADHGQLFTIPAPGASRSSTPARRPKSSPGSPTRPW